MSRCRAKESVQREKRVEDLAHLQRHVMFVGGGGGLEASGVCTGKRTTVGSNESGGTSRQVKD